MIKLKLSSFKSQHGELDLPIVHQEKLDKAIERALSGIPLDDRSAGEIFQVIVNGYHIEPDMWETIMLSESDNVLIAPKIQDDFGQILKQVILLVVVAVVTYYFPPAASLANALYAAGAALGTSLLLNALIPPPVPELNGAGGTGNTVEQSQMYSINGQSNQVRKYNTVPKVYGTHRMFPPLAANPYTEIEFDPVTRNMVQYLYAVYDFGFGPVDIGNIFIGETLLSDYSDVTYNIVDSKKPLVSEGTWDDNSIGSLALYKGDSSTEGLALTLDGNRSAGDPIGDYQAIRNAALNPENLDQEITITFVNTRGLYAYDTQGNIKDRSIDLEIYFAKVGTEDWRAFNDRTYVDSFSALGGDEAYNPVTADILPLEIVPGVLFNHLGVYTALDTGGYTLDTGNEYMRPGESKQAFNLRWGPYGRNVVYGLPAGATQIRMKADSRLLVGTSLVFNGKTIGAVQSVATYIPVNGYVTVTLEDPLLDNLRLFTYREFAQSPNVQYVQFVPAYNHFAIENKTTKKVYIGVGIIGKAKITRNDTAPCYSTFKFSPKATGQFKIRVDRVQTTSAVNFQVSDSLSITSLNTRFNTLPIRTDKRHTFLELKIRATNQLNGVVQNLSADVTSILDVWNGSAWVKQATDNPAWVFADLLTGEANKRAIDKSRLHIPSLVEWANFCNAIPTAPPSVVTYNFKRFTCNFILDYPATLQEVLSQVASSSQAGINIIDGKYGVLVDRLRTTPVQIFTPRNSKNFSSVRSYTRRPDAVKVRFIEPGIGWDTTEVLAYDDGFDSLTATEFDELLCFGCTNAEQAWRFGRYMIAQNRLRQETINLTVDFEYLVCTRGDYVQITQDAMKVGGTPARVKSVSGSQITIDDGIETSNLISYGYVFRKSTGEIDTDTLTVINSDTFVLDGDIPAVGDLIVIGEVTKIVYDCLVKSIAPSDDLTATLTLVEKADAVYLAESTDNFPAYDPQLSQTVNPDFDPPSLVTNFAVADSSYQCNQSGQGYDYYIDLVWDNPVGSAFEFFQIYVNDGTGYIEAGTTRNNVYRYIVDQTLLGDQHQFKVLAVSAAGKKMELLLAPEISQTPLRKMTPPTDVEFLASNITGEVIQLSWQKIDDCDCQEYIIRYSPNVNALWESSIPLLRVDRNVNLASTQARSGIYFIKARDFAGNESAGAVAALTTIPQLFNLNVIEETTDFPTLPGTFDLAEADGSTLVLQKLALAPITYHPTGYYYYESLLDLGEIYTVRLQSLIQAEGLTEEDIIINWLTLDTVQYMANAGSSDWDVKAEYRATNEFNVMVDWITLSSINPISEGNQDLFTPWREFIMGDATGRIFQFRLKLLSYRDSVTPRVFDGTIRADMPDRVESFNNISAPSGGYALSYAPSFAGPGTTPNIQISIDGAASGDYWSFDYRTLDGFYIRFFDKNNNPVARQFDVAVKGYGRKTTSII